MICRLYDVESGSININKENILDVDINNLRSKIGYVPQDIYLVDATIKKNIAFGYLNKTNPNDYKKQNFSIEIEKKKYKAFIETAPLHDPKNKLLKS